ncbi:STAS domain-containing protein [Nonomuraea polychroma]|uniref:STAS domain-containing protein n=1 Tax=Nonomuraea polychroma TaxID=46176 RepID=UPI003D94457F
MDAPHDMGVPGPVVHRGAVLEVSPLSGRPGIRVRGEISVVTRPSWEEALAELARQHAEVSYVELSDVGFVDMSGVTALAVTAMDLPGGRVVVEHPPPHVPRVLEMFWPGLEEIEVVPR